MHPIVLFIVLLLFLGSSLCVLLSWLAWRRRNEVGAPLFMVLMFACGIWSFGYGMELFADTIVVKRVWYDVSYWGIALIAPAWLGFMMQISGHAQRLPRFLIPLLFVESALLIVLNYTNDWHGWLWSGFWIWNWYGLPFLMANRAVGFLIHTAYAYVLLIIGFVFYGIYLLRSPKIAVLQIGILLLGVLLPFAANILDVLQMPVLGPINLTPIALTTVGAGAGWFVFRFRISDLLFVVGSTVFQQMQDGVLVLDLERSVRNLNPAALQLLGRTEAELNNRHVVTVLPWADAFFERLPTPAAREPADQQPSPMWRCELMSGGAVQYIELTVTPLYNPRGRLQGELVVLHDVTGQQHMEEALRHAHRMEGVGLLAGGIAHDFNNLLTSIMGQNALALHHLPPDASARKNIEKSMLSAKRAADLTRQLLAYAGKGQLMVEPLDLNEAILENVALMESAVPKKIDFSLSLADTLPTIQADRGHIQSIVMNLVLNAVEAIGDAAGNITIKTLARKMPRTAFESFMQAEKLTPGTYVCLSVQDSGRGMDAETINLIFDPFFSTKSGGRGLGLSTTLGIVHSHSGSMRVRSSPGSGAVFELILPVRESELPFVTLKHEGADTPHVEPLAGAVLVIDDEEAVREALEDLLASFGLQVELARDGLEGLRCYDAGKGAFDLVMLDMSMPVMDGMETYRHLRGRSPQLPILLMSGYSDAIQSGKQERDAHTLFIHKPYTTDKLRSAITELMRKEVSRTDIMHTEATHTEATHTEATHSEATHTEITESSQADLRTH
ncbi:MAG: response regulator [Caldilineaceae bacterium]|nr:response regulator [Caldilineaceae bacterium]